jgi:hypothetical protein
LPDSISSVDPDALFVTILKMTTSARMNSALPMSVRTIHHMRDDADSGGNCTTRGCSRVPAPALTFSELGELPRYMPRTRSRNRGSPTSSMRPSATIARAYSWMNWSSALL